MCQPELILLFDAQHSEIYGEISGTGKVTHCHLCHLQRHDPTRGFFAVIVPGTISSSQKMVLLGRIELPTSSLPMTRSTTELQQHYLDAGAACSEPRA